MAKNTGKVVVPECLHPLDKSFDQERGDGSGCVDRICGVCGFTMCEVLKPSTSSGVDAATGQKCTHPPFNRDWVLVEDEVKGLLCSCGYAFGDRKAAPGEFLHGKDPEMEAAVQVAEASFSKEQTTENMTYAVADAGALAEQVEAGLAVMGDESASIILCGNRACKSWDDQEADKCGIVMPGGEYGPVTTCGEFLPFNDFSGEQIVIAKDHLHHLGDPCIFCGTAHDDVKPGPCPGHQKDTCTGGACAACAPCEMDLAAGSDKAVAYVSPSPDKIGDRFQELLPVPVDEEELAKLGAEMAEQFDTWSKTKVDGKKFAKACKEVTDRCEARMVELKEIIQDQARMAPIDVQWEYNYSAREKVLRRCDTWEIVKRETLSIEECQAAFDFNSEANVEKLREVQRAAAGEKEEATILEPVKAIRSICAECMRESCRDELPHPTKTECIGFSADLSPVQATNRDLVCKTWATCPQATRCFSPANEAGLCLEDLRKEAEAGEAERENWGEALGAES